MQGSIFSHVENNNCHIINGSFKKIERLNDPNVFELNCKAFSSCIETHMELGLVPMTNFRVFGTPNSIYSLRKLHTHSATL